MVIHYSKTVLIFQCFDFLGCIIGCKNVLKSSFETPLASQKTKHHFNWTPEELNERVAIRVYPLSDSVYSGQDLQFNLSFLNNSADTVNIFMGTRTIKILEIQDTTVEDRIKSLEKQMNLRIIGGTVSEVFYPRNNELTDSKLAMNNRTTLVEIFPFDSLTKTATFNFNKWPRAERQFCLIYKTENYRLLMDTLIIDKAIPVIATGIISSAPFVIDVIRPAKRE